MGIILIALLLTAHPISSQLVKAKTETKARAPFNFRKTRWGMSVSEVKSSERSKPLTTFTSEGELCVMFEATIDEIDGTSVYYKFDRGKLVEGGYLFDADNIGRTSWAPDYDHIKSLLSIRYGSPDEDQRNWQNADMEQAVQDDEGMGIELGVLDLDARWDANSSIIQEELGLSDNQVSFSVRYRSSKFLASSTATKTKAEASQF
ncbi:MAG: hypothetical protein ACRDF4_02940 [Rhabdochlamydiaceae bacterium]